MAAPCMACLNRNATKLGHLRRSIERWDTNNQLTGIAFIQARAGFATADAGK